MAEVIPTVRVVRDRPPGYKIINLANFDASEHVLFDAPAETAEKKPRAKKAKGDNADLIAAVVDILDPLDVPNDDANGLTLRELHADIAGLGLDVDPTMSAADLLALRDLHREEQAAGE